MRVFYLLSPSDPASPLPSLTLDLNRPSEAGFSFLTLSSVVQRQPPPPSPSITLRSQQSRPDAAGDARCTVFKSRSSVTFYTGFLPLLKGFNGENGLVRSMGLWECPPSSKEALAREKGVTRGCYGEEHPALVLCQRPLFTWGPGSPGEQLEEGSGLEVERGHLLLLRVEYNPGSGFLMDDSGLEVLYQRRKGLRPVARLEVASLGSSTEGRSLALCPASCLASDQVLLLPPLLRVQVRRVNVTSVALSGGPLTSSAKVGYSLSETWPRCGYTTGRLAWSCLVLCPVSIRNSNR